MAKRLTVFYSWQSDTPSSINRNFIERALIEALKRLRSDAMVENALRDATIELDKDTAGVAGSPPIAETILRKIDECVVFVADVTFVGESKAVLISEGENPRQFPNPNVMLEYGYALKNHSHTRLIAIMNTVFGKPDADSLPFDLRHLRWPITYHLSGADLTDRDQQFEKLVKSLALAIGLIVANHKPEEPPLIPHVRQKSSEETSVFFETTADLFGDDNGNFAVPRGAKAYLRLCPTNVAPPIRSQLTASKIAATGTVVLMPFGRVNGWSYDRNRFGAIAYERPSDGNLFHFTQLFLNREIWGIDAEILYAEQIRERLQKRGQDDAIRYIASGYISECFTKALQNYLAFAQTKLELTTPLAVEAGLTGIKGYLLAFGNNQIWGKALENSIVWSGQVTSFDEKAWDILSPFFDRVWENCGIERPVENQRALAKFFGGTTS